MGYAVAYGRLAGVLGRDLIAALAIGIGMDAASTSARHLNDTATQLMTLLRLSIDAILPH